MKALSSDLSFAANLKRRLGQDKRSTDFCCGRENEMHKKEPTTELPSPRRTALRLLPALSSPLLRLSPLLVYTHSYQSAVEDLLCPHALPSVCSWATDLLSTHKAAFGVALPDLGALSGERVLPCPQYCLPHVGAS